MEKSHDQIEYAGYWIRRFLCGYLTDNRNLSGNTVKAYRDAIRLLLTHICQKRHVTADKVLITDITPQMVLSMLENLEHTRGCSVSTRNLRLSAFVALAKFVASQCPEYIEWCRNIRNIPVKKAPKNLITYLEKEEMDALLAAPDPNTEQGYRDYAMLLFMYNAGTRADETANMRIGDLQLPRGKKGTGLVTITGKGQKTRMCPLWAKTCRVLRNLIGTRGESEFLFTNRFGNPITRYGIYEMVTKYGKAIESQYPAVKEKRLSPHTIRHTTASHLLQAGVDINTIRAWLGHVSIETTNQYAEINMKMKIEAIEKCNIVNVKIPKRHWRDDKGLMDFLISI